MLYLVNCCSILKNAQLKKFQSCNVVNTKLVKKFILSLIDGSSILGYEYVEDGKKLKVFLGYSIKQCGFLSNLKILSSPSYLTCFKRFNKLSSNFNNFVIYIPESQSFKVFKINTFSGKKINGIVICCF